MSDIPSSQPLPPPTTTPQQNATAEDVAQIGQATPRNAFSARLLMQRKEVGTIIGRKGEIANQIRSKNNVHLNISDSSTSERVVTISGEPPGVFSAFEQICRKFEQENLNRDDSSATNLTFRLIVPASQCGSIIGKSGARISQLREKTGAAIQVSADPLPNSTERTVVITAQGAEPVVSCFVEICQILIEHPSKSDTIQYRPIPNALNPNSANLLGGHPSQFNPIAAATAAAALSSAYQQHPSLSPLFLLNQHQQQYLANAAAAVATIQGFSNQATPKIATQQQQQQQSRNYGQNTQGDNSQTKEMLIPNELIGCVIGRGGRKITEIRQISGASIKIADLVEGRPDRRIIITGSAEQIAMADALIKSRIAAELQAAVLNR